MSMPTSYREFHPCNKATRALPSRGAAHRAALGGGRSRGRSDGDVSADDRASGRRFCPVRALLEGEESFRRALEASAVEQRTVIDGRTQFGDSVGVSAFLGCLAGFFEVRGSGG